MCGSKTKPTAMEPSSISSKPRRTPTWRRRTPIRSSQNTESSETSRSTFSFKTARSAFTSEKSQLPRVFTFWELKEATRDFSPFLMINDGGFGASGGIYRGKIKSSEDPHIKLDIAVKFVDGLQDYRDWVREVNVLGMVEHPNLVKLVGYCAEDFVRLLVYEYMPHGSVQDHLSTRFSIPLSWDMRLRIAQDAARGLTYLHEEMDIQIIFKDFKASNIFFDDHWNAKLSDLWMARLWPSKGLTHVSTAVVDTVAFADPECIETIHHIDTENLTTKSDVWFYGVFLYQLITGRRPLELNRPKREQKLWDWIRLPTSDTKKVQMILDPRLEGKYSLKSAIKLSIVADQCLVKHPEERPKMSEVLEMVEEIV